VLHAFERELGDRPGRGDAADVAKLAKWVNMGGASVNHSAPSGPVVMPRGPFGTGNSVITPPRALPLALLAVFRRVRHDRNH